MLSLDHMALLDSRGLDVELADDLGLSTVTHRWPVAQDNGPPGWVEGAALCIPFLRDGKVVRRKFKRTADIEGAPAYLQDKGGLKIAFNEDCLRDENLLPQPLIITEGELDCVSALQAGFRRAISVPDGAPPPGDRSAKDLEGGAKYNWLDDIRALIVKDRVPEIIIAADGDANGAALLQDLSVLLGRFRCKFVTYPKSKADRGRERCKDLNEVLQDYGAKGVVETINRAQWLQVDGVYLMSDLPPLPEMVIYEPRGELIKNHIKLRLGDFSVWTGVPGFGKSTFLNDFLCGIAQDHDATLAWASFEQEPQRDHRRNLRAWWAGADLLDPGLTPYSRPGETVDQWIDRQHVFIVPSEDEDATLDWLLDKMQVAVVRYGARIVIIDPWNEVEHARERGETETEYVGRAIRALKRFAKAFQVHVCLVAHPTKSVKDGEGNYKMPTLYDISGSSNFYNKADLGVIVHREDEDTTLVKVQKSRYHETIGRPGEVRLAFNSQTRRYVEVSA